MNVLKALMVVLRRVQILLAVIPALVRLGFSWEVMSKNVKVTLKIFFESS